MQAVKGQKRADLCKKSAQSAPQQIIISEGRSRASHIDPTRVAITRTTWQKIENKGADIGVGMIDMVLTKFRERYRRMHFFADTGTYAGMMKMGIVSKGVCGNFRSNRAGNIPQAHYCCPIMTPGLWTLAVVKVIKNGNNKWILHSLRDVGQRVFKVAMEHANGVVTATRSKV